MIELISLDRISQFLTCPDYEDEEMEGQLNKMPKYIKVTDVLDLHGTDPKIIPEMIDDFIANAMLLGIPTLRIIHGKGQSRLKLITHKTLERNKFVKKFYDAPVELGHWGATIVEIAS
jgi:DNA mismatch repair protein MutS2